MQLGFEYEVLSTFCMFAPLLPCYLAISKAVIDVETSCMQQSAIPKFPSLLSKSGTCLINSIEHLRLCHHDSFAFFFTLAFL